MWLTISTIFFSHGKIFSHYTKVVIMLWLFIVLILTTSYTACLSSILTAQKLEPVLSDNKVGYSGDPFVLKYLQEVMGYKQQKIERIGIMDDTLLHGDVTTVYVEAPYLRVFLSEHSGYTAYGEPHRLGGFGFVFPKGYPLATDFSEAILELSEEGKLKQLEDKWFSCSLTSCPSTVNNSNKGSLSLESFWFLFVFTILISSIVMLLYKARSLPSYGSCSLGEVGISLRERCERLWRSRLKRWNDLQLPRVLSISLPEVAPEPSGDAILPESNNV